MVRIKNPITVIIQAGTEGSASSDLKITSYSDGKITGENLGTETGTVYLLDRDTHSYVEQTVTSWSSTEISCTIDLTEVVGNTCLFVRTSDNKNSNKLMVWGDIAVSNYGVIYLQEDEKNPTTIRKVYLTSTSDVAQLVMPSNYYYQSRTTATGNTYDLMNVVGVQFSSNITTSYTAPSYFLSSLLKFNQPVYFPSWLKLTNNYLMRYDYTFDCPLVFADQTSVGSYFMYNCYSFNQPLDISMFTLLSMTYFMFTCRSFNSELKLPSVVTTTSLGAYFLNYDYGFNQKLELPSNLTSIGNYFLRNCYGYSQPLELPSTLKTIGTYFMSGCYSYNQPIVLPVGVTSIPTYFLQNCYAFNQPLVFEYTGTLSIGTYFMQNCQSFNQSLDFISQASTIAASFMSGCSSINQPLTFNGSLVKINNNFMNNCISFSQYVDLRNVTSVGTALLYGNYNIRSVNVQNATPPTDSATLSTASVSGAPAYYYGITLYGTNRTTWQTSLPDSTTSGTYRKLIDGGE